MIFDTEFIHKILQTNNVLLGIFNQVAIELYYEIDKSSSRFEVNS